MLDGLPPVMWFIRRHMRQHRTCGLSVPQFRTLCLLDRYPTASLSLVAENLGCSQPSASRLVSGLVSRGIVTRREGATDRRQIELILTASGQRVLNKARAATLDRLAAELEGMSEADRRTIASAMTILNETFAKTLSPAPTNN